MPAARYLGRLTLFLGAATVAAWYGRIFLIFSCEGESGCIDDPAVLGLGDVMWEAISRLFVLGIVAGLGFAGWGWLCVLRSPDPPSHPRLRIRRRTAWFNTFVAVVPALVIFIGWSLLWKDCGGDC